VGYTLKSMNRGDCMVKRLPSNRYKMTNHSKDNLKKIGFKKVINEPDLYTYRFPVYKYNNIPTEWCVLNIDSSTGEVNIDVVNNSGNFLSAFYQHMSGFDEFIEKINSRIKNKLSKLGIKKVKK